jgi:hypothetical protein
MCAVAASPLNSSSALVMTGPVDGTWAKVAGARFCNETGLDVLSSLAVDLTRPGSSAALWQRAYPLLLAGRTYVSFTHVADYISIATCDELTDGGTSDAFMQCAGSSAPTPVPSAAPTAAPTGAGPLTEAACATDWAAPLLGSLVPTRYCNDPACTGVYRNEHGDVYLACPPLPGEGRVRDNAYPCDYCVNDSVITMMYCNETCTGTYVCPTDGALFYNACTEHYPDAPVDYGPMSEAQCLGEYGGTPGTWAEYSFATTGVRYVRYCETPICSFTFQDDDPGVLANACPPLASEARVRDNTDVCVYCMGNATGDPIEMMYCGNTTECTGTYFCPYTDAVYYDACTSAYPPVTTTPAPTAAPTPRLTMPECFVAINESCTNAGGADWCKRDDFFRVSNYAVSNGRVVTDEFDDLDAANRTLVADAVRVWLAAYTLDGCWTTAKSDAWFPYGPVAAFTSIVGAPFPHDFYYKFGEFAAEFTYYADLGIRGEALAAIQADGTVEIGNTSHAACDGTLEPSQVNVNGLTQCAFICVAPLYVGEDAPLSLVRANASNAAECAARFFLWINQQSLLRMVHSAAWQKTATLVGVGGPLEYTYSPWWNATDGENCPLLAEGYCSLVLTPHESHVFSANELAADHGGSDPFRLVPVVYISSDVDPAALRRLFWTNLAARSVGDPNMLQAACTGNKTFTLPGRMSGAVTVIAPVVWMGGWNTTGCTGLNGCALLGALNCSRYRGCVWINPTTKTSTTSTHTDPIGTFAPPVASALSSVHLNTDTDVLFFGLIAVAAGVFLIVSARLRKSDYRRISQ